MTEGLEAAYERSLQQAALIGLCNGEQRSDLALSFVENDFCENPLEAAAAINNAASIIINVDDMQTLLDKTTEHAEYDRSEQLRPLFKSFYRKIVMILSSAKEEELIVDELQEDFDFPRMILEHFVSMVESSLSNDIDRD